MAIKTLSGQWTTLQHKNRALRDKTRKRFYSELGITPAKKVSEIDIPPAGRNANIQSLVEKTINGREGDGDMKAVATLAGTIVGQLSPGFMSLGGLSEAFDFFSHHPEQMRKFFLSDDLHSFEVSKME